MTLGWDDLEEGSELPAREYGPLTRNRLRALRRRVG